MHILNFHIVQNNFYIVPYKELAVTLWNAQEVIDWYNKVISPYYTYKGKNIEGFVLEDLDQHMVKVKTYYYITWKSFRPVIHKAYKKESIDFHKWLLKILNRIYIVDENIWLDLFQWIRNNVYKFSYEPSIIEVRNKWIQERNDV